MPYGSPVRMNAGGFVNGRWGKLGRARPARSLLSGATPCDHAHLSSLIVYPWPCQTEHGGR